MDQNESRGGLVTRDGLGISRVSMLAAPRVEKGTTVALKSVG